MKHTRSIQLAAIAAILSGVTAWGQGVPVQPGGGEEARTEPLISASPVEIDHSQQTVSDFLESPSSSGSADQILMLANRAFDVILTFGGAYDSNPRWSANDEDGEFVTWAELQFLLDSNGLGRKGRGWYWGADVGSSIFSYSNSDRSPTGGRDQGELDTSAFLGLRGAKTDVRFDVDYRLNNGSMIDFLDLDREAGRAQGNDIAFKLGASRRFDHSQLTGYAQWAESNYNSDSFLNDISHFAGDVGWLFSPGFAPRTDVGAGFHVGSYSTERNFDQESYEPSFRFNYRMSPKTTLWGRVGYTFIDYEGLGAVGDHGFTSFGSGIKWAPTAKTWFEVTASRDVRPALVYSNQDYYWNHYQFTVGHLLPANWSLRSYVSYDSGEYFSTVSNGVANRQDDYWRLGGDISHPLNIFDRFSGQISAFYYFNANESTVSVADFEQVFTGMKVGLSY